MNIYIYLYYVYLYYVYITHIWTYLYSYACIHFWYLFQCFMDFLGPSTAFEVKSLFRMGQAHLALGNFDAVHLTLACSAWRLR